ncbi:hypothetical protein BO70DRAFT_363242 [Aspergillus heteromorphus CBS 117.55]|uniref:Uncharacterized protein n=1 Tax=Aspergillus heteromorphus CBS 117.55 TaxID=1448321 RepID=A0A317VVP5_9EURO|nr:uncharacterized protein BO70DRAFT_363242 [Aspergillus heteromorphus CBS 117.55]PWY78363.1 hypothetical protein BO70DRAFT_363242 [Aspergillus heteromorphus CBS 117.55]
MLDENLPTFYLKLNKQSKLWTIYLCQHGNDPDPAYALRYPEPSSPSSQNRYASALYDPYVPDILFGEVLIIPEWTQPSLSAESIRLNNGVPPPPEPLLPSQFTINLYNPDQQVVVHFKPKTWNSGATWTFEMPQHSFRQPSSSTLDRTQTDPAMADTTPKLRFTWRKDGKLSKDMTCFMSGKTTTIPETKAKSKEPDITVSIFKGQRELTLYEPNLYRVEMEDFKGLEVVLLLGAVTIRDVYFASMKDAFHVTKPANMMASSPGAGVGAGGSKPLPGIPAVASGALTSPSRPQPQSPRKSSKQLDEERRTQQLLEQEASERRARQAQRQAEIDRETRRLQSIYGQEEERARMQTPALPPRQQPQPQPQQQTQAQPPRRRPHSGILPQLQTRFPAGPVPSQSQSQPQLQTPTQTQSTQHLPLRPANQPHYSYPYQDGRRRQQTGPYLSTGGGGMSDPRRQSAVRFALPEEGDEPGPALQPKKSSFFRLRRSSADEAKLSKKRSSMF